MTSFRPTGVGPVALSVTYHSSPVFHLEDVSTPARVREAKGEVMSAQGFSDVPPSPFLELSQ